MLERAAVMTIYMLSAGRSVPLVCDRTLFGEAILAMYCSDTLQPYLNVLLVKQSYPELQHAHRSE